MTRHFTFLRSGRYVGLIAGVFLLFFIFGVFTNANAATTDKARDGRLVTIHDRGEERVILTHAQTIRDALADAHVVVVDQDSVEPGLDEPLVATDYTVNIYRARPVVVVDGAMRTKVLTSAQTQDAIAADAGISLHDEDEADLSQSQNIIGDGASVILTIKRATEIHLNLYGTTTTAYTQAKTVGEMLDSKHLVLGKNDTLSVDRDEPITAGMTIALWRNGVQTSTVQEDIPFTVREVQDFDQPVGYHKIQTPGTKGHRVVTYEITIKNGKEVRRKAIQTVVLEKSKEQVVVVGAALPAGSHQDWMEEAGMSPSNYGFIDFIFTHESHWNPAARNPSGLYVGLGQTSPAKLSAACPNWQGDPICQIRLFDNYATGRYGSWQNAYNFWKSNNWW